MLENGIIENASNLENLAKEVLKQYDLKPENIVLIQSGTIKTLWRFTSKGKSYCLKRFKQTHDKVLFSTHAQIHIKNSGGNVPGIILSKNQEPVVQFNSQSFSVYEWINGKNINFSTPEDLKAAIEGLATFHLSSKGYKPVGTAKVSSKSGRWPEQYESMKNRMLEWKEIATSGKLAAYSAYLKHIGTIIPLCTTAENLLKKTSYSIVSTENAPSTVLCHQDYGPGNVILTDKGIIVLDLDGVTYDLPARDLRKIIGKLSEVKGSWNTSLINNIVTMYSRINPLTPEEKEILYIDLLFPHWFFGLVKNQFQNNKPLKASEIEKTAAFEQSKIPILKSLLDHKNS